MLSAIIYVIVALIIAGVLWWAVNAIVAVLPIPEPIRTVINVLLIVVLVFIVVYALLQLIGGAGVHVPVLR
jgi:hypothetical protein